MPYNAAMRNTQFLMLGGIAIVLAGVFATMSLHEISAQQTTTTTTNSTTPQSNQTTRMEIPQLNGSVNVQQQTNQFLQDSVKVPFATALQTAQSEVGNGTAISGRLGVVQGYLVYTFKLANFDAQTSRIVIVDAGNGSVLYTSGDMPLFFGGLGCSGGHGTGGGYGGGGYHMGFGSHGGKYDRYGGTSDGINSGGQSSSSGVTIVAPAVNV
jgi:uncharacterized membrane protein YkoI